MQIILASASPRRREILENLGIEFEIVVSNADESCNEDCAEKLVCTLSERKARATEEMLKESGRYKDDMLIIGCDSVVVSKGEILGKPNDRQHATYMLNSLSGSSHHVISGLTLLYKGKAYTDFEKTEVLFDELTESEIDEYVKSGECDDKAGGYAIQGKASRYIKGICGCYYNVVGLPVHLMFKLAKENGISL